VAANAVVMGRTIAAPGFQEANFFSTAAFLDFDLVVLDLGGILEGFYLSAKKSGDASALTNDSGTYLLRTLKRRSEELLEYLKHGRPVVILATPLGAFHWADSRGDYADARASDYFLGCGPATVAQSGSAIEFCGPRWAQEFARPLLPHLQYFGVLSEDKRMIPMFVIKGTKKPVGGYFDLADKWLLILPPFLATSAEADRDFGEAMNLFIAAHKERKIPAQLPDWHIEFLLPGESALRQTAIELKDQLAQHHKKIEENLVESQALTRLKGLFTEKGQKLVDLVKLAMETLGFQVEPGPEGQDDLIAQYGERYAVLEVKGRDQSSAAEKDAAQLEKWSSRFYEEHGKEPKSILVVNAYRDMPLDQRTAAVFPNQMLKYSIRKEQCLLSGLQLLCLVSSAKTETERKAAAESLLNAIGIYPRFRDKDWTEIIAHTPRAKKKA
jgi:hypothetical protein